MLIIFFYIIAVQNERDRISSRRPSYEEPVSANGLTINVLINAEQMSRQVNYACFLFLLHSMLLSSTLSSPLKFERFPHFFLH